jgi:hypothetical protein
MAARLVLLPHAQHYDGTVLKLRLLIVPRGSPLEDLLPGAPSFAKANFKFEVHVVPGLGSLPVLGGTPLTTKPSPTVPTAEAVFTALTGQFNIDPSLPRGSGVPSGTQVRKHLPSSYQTAANYAPGRTELVSTDSRYLCLIKSVPSKPKPPVVGNGMIPWGKVLAAILRNAAIAEAAGLIRSFDIPITPANLLAAGGYLYLTLASDSDGFGLVSDPNGLKIYCSRIPALTNARDVFSPVLFPVSKTPLPGVYDTIFEEVDDYDDGWAKIVHCGQPQRMNPFTEDDDGSRPVTEMGIRLGWDDEQVTIWMNRQLDENQASLDCPIGVTGYRVDARLANAAEWHSLVAATGDVGIGNLDIGHFDGELGVETHPVQMDADIKGKFWLPTYFTAWTGRSLVSLDDVKYRLDGGPDVSNRPGVKGTPPKIQLTYGKTYDFRVRLMDHTGGGPDKKGSPIVPGPSPIASFPFRRWIRAGAPTLVPSSPGAPNPPTSIQLMRPLLNYPAIYCTGAPNAIARLIADIPAARAASRLPGLPDLDVAQVQITVEVQGLVQDPITTDGHYMPVLKVYRDFPSDPSQPITINITWKDLGDVSTLSESSSGPLVLPRARNIRLRFAAVCRADPKLEYFGAQDVRSGPDTYTQLRNEATDETSFFLHDLPSNRIKALFMQPEIPTSRTVLASLTLAGKPNQLPADNPTVMAAALGLRNDGMTLRSRPGERAIFGCSGAIRHMIGPDNASISFATSSDLALHWIVVMQLTAARDWSWDGFQDGLIVMRDGQEVGRFTQNTNVSKDALKNPRRTETRFIFFDAIEPKPTGPFPAELNPHYTVKCSFTGSPTVDPDIDLKLRLPVTTAPSQVPKVVSAGIAMSPYKRDKAGYSWTEQRSKALWIEFDSPPDDPNDTYFCRVLRNVPDPLLSSFGNNLPETPEPPFAVEPEQIRIITPSQSDDSAGLDAMRPLLPSTTTAPTKHYQLPLPAGLSDSSPELFGFFTYELRLGHRATASRPPGIWSTAHGRFGRPLRVCSVQHPPPPLVLDVLHTSAGIAVSAPYAASVLDGVPATPAFPRTSMWILLYVQAAQLDGSDRRNVLLSRSVATKSGLARRVVAQPFGTAHFTAADIGDALAALAFKDNAPLSVLGVELLPQDAPLQDPVGADLGGQRFLRTSALTPVPHICG